MLAFVGFLSFRPGQGRDCCPFLWVTCAGFGSKFVVKTRQFVVIYTPNCDISAARDLR